MALMADVIEPTDVRAIACPPAIELEGSNELAEAPCEEDERDRDGDRERCVPRKL
jgi:hypothetical protein